jgi:hypothetical protein
MQDGTGTGAARRRFSTSDFAFSQRCPRTVCSREVFNFMLMAIVPRSSHWQSSHRCEPALARVHEETTRRAFELSGRQAFASETVELEHRRNDRGTQTARFP